MTSPPRYVLLREDHNTYKEVYFCGMRHAVPQTVEDPQDAVHFATARDAYEAGAIHEMYWWRVGRR